MNTKPKFIVTTYFTYSVTVEVEAKNSNDAWIEGRKKAINTPPKDMEFVRTETTIVKDEQLSPLYYVTNKKV